MALRFTSLIILTFIFFGCASNQTNNNKLKAQLHLEIGTTNLVKGNIPTAFRELLAAEKLDPRDPTIQNNLGMTYLVSEKYDPAEACFKKALAENKNYTDARNNLGRLYITVGLYKKAIDELRIATTDLTYPEPEKSWSNLGQAYFFDKQYDLAKKALQNSLKNRKDSCFTMNYYGRTLFELKNFREAKDSFDQAIPLCEKEKFEEPNFYSALSLFKLGQVDEAHARLQQLIQTYPTGRFTKKARELLETL